MKKWVILILCGLLSLGNMAVVHAETPATDALDVQSMVEAKSNTVDSSTNPSSYKMWYRINKDASGQASSITWAYQVDFTGAIPSSFTNHFYTLDSGTIQSKSFHNFSDSLVSPSVVNESLPIHQTIIKTQTEAGIPTYQYELETAVMAGQSVYSLYLNTLVNGQLLSSSVVSVDVRTGTLTSPVTSGERVETNTTFNLLNYRVNSTNQATNLSLDFPLNEGEKLSIDPVVSYYQSSEVGLIPMVDKLSAQWDGSQLQLLNIPKGTLAIAKASVPKSASPTTPEETTTVKPNTTTTPNPTPSHAPTPTASISYSSHVSYIGWESYVQDGASGADGRLEAIKAKVSSSLSGDLIYQSHIQNIGWMSEVKNDAISGTVGRSLRMEAISFRLTGELAQQYDVYYRTKLADIGWTTWAKNGEKSGSQGYGKSLMDIQIRLVPKGQVAPGNDGLSLPFYIRSGLTYQGHVQNIGWMSPVFMLNTAGTVGRSLRLEALKVSLQQDLLKNGNLSMQYLPIQSSIWSTPVNNGEILGTTGIGQAVQAMKLSLTGDLAKYYNLFYRVHISNVGWLDWAKNGEQAGSTGIGSRIEAIQMFLEYKDFPTNFSSDRPMINPLPEMNMNLDPASILNYQGYANQQWSANMSQGQSVNTQNTALEALKVTLNEQLMNSNLSLEVKPFNQGWLAAVQSNQQAGQGSLEAVRMKFRNGLENLYDVYYRTRVQDFGWLAWVKNGEDSGTSTLGKTIQDIQIQVTKKDAGTVDGSGTPYLTKEVIQYSSHVSNIGWMNYVTNPQTSGNESLENTIESLKFALPEQLRALGSIQGVGKVQDLGEVSATLGQDSYLGTVGKSKRLEAISLSLTGELANQYDLYYRVKPVKMDWLGWTKNGENFAGCIDCSRGITAIQIDLVRKGLANYAESTSYTTQSLNGFGTTTWNGRTIQVYYNDAGSIAKSNFRLNGVYYQVDSTTGEILKTQTLMNDKVWWEGIDISQWNAGIDLSQYKNGFVMIRVGFGWSSTPYSTTIDTFTQMDKQFKANVRQCEALGIPYGFYWFSYARNSLEARLEAQTFKQVTKGYHPQLGYWMDVEKTTFTQDYWTANTINANIRAFTSEFSLNNMNIGIYADYSTFTYYIDTTYPKWVAHYGRDDGNWNVDLSKMNNIKIHQYTSRPLDRDVFYVDPAKLWD